MLIGIERKAKLLLIFWLLNGSVGIEPFVVKYLKKIKKTEKTNKMSAKTDINMNYERKQIE